MTNQVLFIQGGGKRVHDEWDDKSVDSLERELGQDCVVHYPRVWRTADGDLVNQASRIGRRVVSLRLLVQLEQAAAEGSRGVHSTLGSHSIAM
jgi:hypothetical protein